MELKEPVSKERTLALGFIGVGRIGKNRMEAILDTKMAKAVLICEPSEKNMLAALASAPTAKTANLTNEIYTDPFLDAVVIASPNALHATQSLLALHEGKSVFCQKPLGRTAIEIAAVVEMARTKNKLLSVDLPYRYIKAFKAVYETIRSGELGKIYSVDLVFHDASGPGKPWFYDIELSGGGCAMDLGIHLLDMALYCLGFPKVQKVNSHLFYHGERVIKPDTFTEDFAKISLVTEDTNIDLQCSWSLSAGSDAVIEARFYGTDGGIAFKNSHGSFYDFVVEKYHGAHTETLVVPQDDWSGRAGAVWTQRLANGEGFDEQSGRELVEIGSIMDRIYDRE